MEFKVELHAHTSEVSSCGKLPASQLAQGFAMAGYKTLVITDHIDANRFAVGTRFLPARAEMFLSGWRAARAEGEKWGLHVLLGAEARLVSGDEDFLILGLEEEHIAPLMVLLDSKPDNYGLYKRMQEWGMLVIQAHPFRPGLRTAPADALDGVEVYNGNPRHNSHNDQALAFARAHGLLMTSGSDAHQFMDVGRGGMISPEEIETNAQLLAFLRGEKQPRRIETLTGFVKK